ncbi:hypothetical protein JHK87_044974 [Glycine soja]|nr:hypothetical protein JHK87_044974 [Glycine soja]
MDIVENSIRGNGEIAEKEENQHNTKYLCSNDFIKKGPDLLVDKDSAAAFLPDECQLDAYRTVAYIEKVLYSWSNSNGEVKAVQTSKNTIHNKKVVIVAAGYSTSSLIHNLKCLIESIGGSYTDTLANQNETLADRIKFDHNGLKLVKLRGEAMQDAVDVARSAMVSVIGLDSEKVQQLCDAISNGIVLASQVE